jgi:hypothetical protein
MRRTTVLLAGCMLAAACGSDATSYVEEDAVVGTYTLSTLAGKPLPGVVESSGTSMREVLASTILLKAGHKCSADFTYRDTVNGTATTTDVQNPCTFDVDGTSITLTLTNNGAEQPGTIQAGEIRILDSVGEWVFLKQERL